MEKRERLLTVELGRGYREFRGLGVDILYGGEFGDDEKVFGVAMFGYVERVMQ